MIRTAVKVIFVLLALLVLLVVALNYSYTKDISIPFGVSGKHVSVDNIRLRVMQTGHGRDVLFLHGSLGNLEDFEAVTPMLADRFRVTSYDRPGHGYSQMPAQPANIALNAHFATRLIETLDLQDVIVVGHSYGGSIALKMAIEQAPLVKQYILLAPATLPLGERRKIEYLLAKPVIGLGLMRLLRPVIAESMLSNGLRFSMQPELDAFPENFFRQRILLWNNSGILFTRTQQTNDVNAELAQMSQHYAELDTPLVILLGSEDAHDDIRNGSLALHKMAPNSDLIQVNGAGHYLQYQAPQAVVRAIGGAAGY